MNSIHIWNCRSAFESSRFGKQRNMAIYAKKKAPCHNWNLATFGDLHRFRAMADR